MNDTSKPAPVAMAVDKAMAYGRARRLLTSLLKAVWLPSTAHFLKQTVAMRTTNAANALAALVVRMATVCFKKCAVEGSQTAFSRDVNNLLALPYAMALSTAIATGAGFDVSFIYWLALFLWVVTILPNHLKAKA